MTDSSGLSAAKVVLLVVQSATKADIPSLRYLVASHPKILRRENLILRILLTFLPETLESSSYVPLIDDLNSGEMLDIPKPSKFPSLDQDISDEVARKRVRRLHLLPLEPQPAPIDAGLDPLTLFLLHRAYKVDSETGLLPQILALIVPFIHHFEYLRTWTIVTLLPLLRYSYYYYPEEGCLRTLQSMNRLDNVEGLRFLLSKAESAGNKGYELVGRDLKGLVGPWMYGEEQKRRSKNASLAGMAGKTILPLEDTHSTNIMEMKWPGWNEVFKWIISCAESSWPVIVHAIEQWDGPGDVDLGGFEDAAVWLTEDDKRVLKVRYGQASMAAAYLIREDSVEAVTGAHLILSRIISLLDHERISNLPASVSLLPSVPLVRESGIMRPENAKYLHSFHLEERNVLTRPTKQATSLLYALTLSAYLLTRVGCRCSVKRAGDLSLLQNQVEQKAELQRFMNAASQVSKADDKYWIRIRDEILWLHDWTSEPVAPPKADSTESHNGNGIFGSVKKEQLEIEILKTLLSNGHMSLARSIYETAPEKPLSKEQVAEVVLEKSRIAFNNASNGNKTRGGMKIACSIIDAFFESVEDSVAGRRQASLIELADQLAKYRIVLQNGHVFKPVDVRSHPDPLAIIALILDQNPGIYTQLNQMRKLGNLMVLSGLTIHDTCGHAVMAPKEEELEKSIASTRTTSMSVDAALAVDDFETAYSYVMNNLIPYSSKLPPGSDDWSWRASFQAGKYRRNTNTTMPTHLGNANANLEIRHLEQRMECLSQALRIAPKTVLPEILNAYRRCEEELETQTTLEEEREAAWDDQGDQLNPLPTRELEAADNAPMSLFDLGRRSAENAKRSLASLRASEARYERLTRESPISHTNGATDQGADINGGTKADTIRKRDQLRNAAVGTLASGIGWLINAPPVVTEDRRDEE